MLSKNQISLIKSLKKSKFRIKEKLFVVEGRKCILELLSSEYVLDSMYALEEGMQKAGNKNIKINVISETELGKISFLNTPSDALALFKMPDFLFDLNEIRGQFSIALDAIRDPGNLGTIVRIVDWFGIENIFCSKDCVDVFNPKCIMASMGSISRVKVHYVNLLDLANDLSTEDDFEIYAATMGGENIRYQKFSKNGLLIMGNESNGVSEELMSVVTKEVGIAGFDRGSLPKAESLNVATATAIICHEIRKL